MKRDITVTLSLVVLAVEYAAGFALRLPQPTWLVVLLVMVPQGLAGVRGFVLWFQTLADACRPGEGKPARTGWIVLHFLFGPLASYPYYYRHRAAAGDDEGGALSDDELKRRANAGAL